MSLKTFLTRLLVTMCVIWCAFILYGFVSLWWASVISGPSQFVPETPEQRTERCMQLYHVTHPEWAWEGSPFYDCVHGVSVP